VIVNIETIISKYFKENFSITQSSVDEMKNIFVLERNKKGRRTHKLMKTDQNLPRSYLHYVVRVVYLYNSSYFFAMLQHIKPTFCRSVSSNLLK